MANVLLTFISSLSFAGLSACQAELSVIDEIDCSRIGSDDVWEKILFHSNGTATFNHLPYDESDGNTSQGIIFSKDDNGFVLYSALNEKRRHCRWEFNTALTSAKFKCGIPPITEFNSESATNALACKKT